MENRELVGKECLSKDKGIHLCPSIAATESNCTKDFGCGTGEAQEERKRTASTRSLCHYYHEPQAPSIVMKHGCKH